MSGVESEEVELERLRKFEQSVYVALAEAGVSREREAGIRSLAAERDHLREKLEYREGFTAVGTAIAETLGGIDIAGRGTSRPVPRGVTPQQALAALGASAPRRGGDDGRDCADDLDYHAGLEHTDLAHADGSSDERDELTGNDTATDKGKIFFAGMPLRYRVENGQFVFDDTDRVTIADALRERSEFRLRLGQVHGLVTTGEPGDKPWPEGEATADLLVIVSDRCTYAGLCECNDDDCVPCSYCANCGGDMPEGVSRG